VASFDAEQTNKRKDNPNYKKGQGNFTKKDAGSSSTSTGLDCFYKPAECLKLDQRVCDKILALCKDCKVSAATTFDEGNTTEETTQRKKKIKLATWPAKKDTVVISSVRTVVAAVVTPVEDSFRVDLTSHADTCSVGNGVLTVNQTERTVRVTPFLKTLGSAYKVPNVKAAIAYNNPKTGEVTILLVHQALHFPEIKNCLLIPMQILLRDIEVNKHPKFLTVVPTSKYHATIAGELLIPLELHGITSFFHGQKPTMKENEECALTELTYLHSHWSPHDKMYAEEEALQNEFDDEPRSHWMIKQCMMKGALS
jgi:hypothetical protein